MIYTGIQLTGGLGMNIYQLKPDIKEEFCKAVLEMEEITGGEGFLVKVDWLKHIGVVDYSLLSGHLWRYDNPSGLNSYFVNTNFDSKSASYLNDIALNSMVHEICFILKWIEKTRVNKNSTPQLFLRIKQVSDNWKCEKLELFLNKILEGLISNQTVIYFFQNLLRINYIIEMSEVIEMSEEFELKTIKSI